MRLSERKKTGVRPWGCGEMKTVRQELIRHAGQLKDEMNLRLLMEQMPEKEVLFVESVKIVEIRFEHEKRRWWRSIMKWKDKIFADGIVNGGRQKELDLAKAVSVLCLALVHCVIECTPEEQLAEGLPFLFDSVIGGPLSAPLFMFAMGIGIAYTERNTFRECLHRGIEIGTIGYLLNICRFLIPFLIGYGITGDYEKYIAPLPYRMFGNDILQFACLVMLLIGLLIKRKTPDGVMLLLCLGMSFLGTCLNGTDFRIPFCNILGGYLIGTEDTAGRVVSDFPVLNWLLVPVSGYLFGKRLLHVKDKRLFYGFFSMAGLLITVVYFFTGIVDRRGMFGEGQNCYYHITTGDCLASIAAAVASLGVCCVAVRYMPKKVMEHITGISQNINEIYCAQWVMVIFAADLVFYILRGTQTLGIFQTMLTGICISAASVPVACRFAEYKRKFYR